MFIRKQTLPYPSSPEKPDADYAHKPQEMIGGQYGEITVAMQYSFQAWNSHIPGKDRDLLFSTAAEEFGHIGMPATMVAQLLEDSPLGVTEKAIQDDPAVAAIIGGTDLQHAIVSGAGARPVDSMGNPWSGSYVTASGNLLADTTSNINAEMQGSVQVARFHHMADDRGVKDMLGFLLARDTMHQNQWLAAARALQKEGDEICPCRATSRAARSTRSSPTRPSTSPTASTWPKDPGLPARPRTAWPTSLMLTRRRRGADEPADPPGRPVLRHHRAAQHHREGGRPGPGKVQ